MNKRDNSGLEPEYDSLRDVIEFQNNMFNPGHYIGTGKVPPVITAPGNAMPLAVAYFSFSALCFIIGIFQLIDLISNNATPHRDKIILLSVLFVAGLLLLRFGFAYLKKALKYRKAKKELEQELVDTTRTDKLWQRTCPNCGQMHDIDYPKCPACKFNYLRK